MNKASAVGFACGVIFLGLSVALMSVGNGQKKAQGAPKPGAVGADGRVAVVEESAESDSATKAPQKKMVDFKPAGNQLLPKVEAPGGGVKMTRSATPGGYRAGQPLDVIVSLDADGKDKLTALALVERLPKGWSFEELTGGAKPVIVPAKGATGELSFVWVQVPAFPCTVSYKLLPGPDVVGAQELQGQAVYRQSGPEMRTEMVKTLVPAAP